MSDSKASGDEGSSAGVVERAGAAMLRWQVWCWAALLAMSAGFVLPAMRVHPDYAVEYMFPDRSDIKTDYDRFKALYPNDDTRALVLVESADAEGIWSPKGMRGVAVLEDRLRHLSGVAEVEGPLSIKDIVAVDGDVRVEPLVPRADLPAAELQRIRAYASSDPVFRWLLTPPKADSVTIRVTLAQAIATSDPKRLEFLQALRGLAAGVEREQGLKITLAGLPVLRSEYTEMIGKDQGVTSPLAMLVILVILGFTFRSFKLVVASLCTMGVSMLWTRGTMGLLGFPEQILTSITPIVVMIISISDTVHIVTHYRERRLAGAEPKPAILAALADSAWPCLLTELTIAAGFLSLWFVNIKMVSQFGLATAAGMLLTWLANVTVLPLLLWLLKPEVAPPSSNAGTAERAFGRFVDWIEKQVTEHPRRIVAATVLLVAVGVAATTQIKTVYYAFDDLRDSSPIKRQVALSEERHGGNTPLVLFIEPKAGSASTASGDPADAPMLDPEIVRLADRLALLLERRFPGEVKNAISLADYVRKTHAILAGPDAIAPDGLPTSRRLIAQELEFIDDGKLLADTLDYKRRTSAVWTMMPDVGSHRVQEILDALAPDLRAEEAEMARRGVPVTITPTSMFAIAADVYATLVGGLLSSLAMALLVSLLVFTLVLRSVRLGLLALVPNVLPLAVTFGFMGLAGIPLTPTTVIVFSITLVIADDDTVQYFARFRQNFLALVSRGEPDPHRTAALGTLRSTGLPMVITSVAVSVGFLALTASQFLGLAKFGLLVGVSLFSAIFGDLLITPILLMKLKPRIDGGRAPAPTAPQLGGSLDV